MMTLTAVGEIPEEEGPLVLRWYALAGRTLIGRRLLGDAMRLLLAGAPQPSHSIEIPRKLLPQ